MKQVIKWQGKKYYLIAIAHDHMIVQNAKGDQYFTPKQDCKFLKSKTLL